MDKGIALPDNCQDFLSQTFADPIAATALAATTTASILAIPVRGSRSQTHRVSDTFADVCRYPQRFRFENHTREVSGDDLVCVSPPQSFGQ